MTEETDCEFNTTFTGNVLFSILFIQMNLYVEVLLFFSSAETRVN